MIRVVTKKNRIWNIFQIMLGSYIAGPFVGCFLISRNYKKLGRDILAKRFIWIGIGTSLFLALSLLLLPDAWIEKIPQVLIPITYTTFIGSYAQQYLKGPIEEYLKIEGVKRHSYIYLIALSIPFLLLFLIFAAGIGFLDAIIAK